MSNDIYFAGHKLRRADFDTRARKLANLFKAQGVGPDHAVAVLCRNDAVYLEIIEACRLVGAYFVTLNWHASADEIIQILEDAHPKLLIGHSDLTAKLSSKSAMKIPVLAVSTPAEITATYNCDPAIAPGQQDYHALMKTAQPLTTDPLRFRGMLAYTSGSTGRPKGIRRVLDTEGPDGYARYKALASAVLQLTPGDRFYTAAPLYHSAPNALSTFCLAFNEVDIYISPKFDAETFLADIERFGITHIYIVPTMMVRLLKLPEAVRKQYDVSSLRFGISTGSAWPSDVKQAMIEWFGPIFYESYGASEIGFMTLISSQEAQEKPGSVGKVLPGGSIKILDDNQAELPTGQAGSIYVDLPQFGDFTYSNTDGDLRGQRYGKHATVGDIGYLDEDGYLFISDRKKDMIISGGANIFPAEIEAALIDMPEVLDCAVIGAPHPEFGEMVVAAVQCSPGCTVTLESLQAYLEKRIARFKLPRKLDIHDELPRQPTGKIFKQRLREPYWKATGRKL